MRDLGYYGEFNEKHVAGIIDKQPKMKHFFEFVQRGLGDAISEDQLKQINKTYKAIRMTPEEVQAHREEEDVVATLEIEDNHFEQADVLEREIAALEKQIQLESKILNLKEAQLEKHDQRWRDEFNWQGSASSDIKEETAQELR